MFKCKKCGKEKELIANLCQECAPELHAACKRAEESLTLEDAQEALELLEKEKSK